MSLSGLSSLSSLQVTALPATLPSGSVLSGKSTAFQRDAAAETITSGHSILMCERPPLMMHCAGCPRPQKTAEPVQVPCAMPASVTMAEWQRSALGIFKRDGIFAEYATVPLVNLHVVPESLSNDQVRAPPPL